MLRISTNISAGLKRPNISVLHRWKKFEQERKLLVGQVYLFVCPFYWSVVEYSHNHFSALCVMWRFHAFLSEAVTWRVKCWEYFPNNILGKYFGHAVLKGEGKQHIKVHAVFGAAFTLPRSQCEHLQDVLQPDPSTKAPTSLLPEPRGTLSRPRRQAETSWQLIVGKILRSLK